MTDASNSKVTGVKLRCLDKETELTADLVVDASGRNSLLPKWLKEIGYQSPTETIVNSFLGYSTRWYEVPENFQADWKGISLAAQPPHNKRGGVLYPVEGSRWIVTVSGIGRDYPPTDEAGFNEFVRSLSSPLIYSAIKNAKPISPVYGYRRTENRWCHYEKLAKMPDNLVAIGDAVCAFNPVYGQGMTCAALSALILDRCLQKQFQGDDPNLKGLTKRFQKQLAQFLTNPWVMATGEDFRWLTTEGGQPDTITRLMHRYIDRVIMLSVHDRDVYRKFVSVVHMIKSPTTLFAPSIVLRVLAQIIKPRLNITSATKPVFR